jgi:hypothetical protein
MREDRTEHALCVTSEMGGDRTGCCDFATAQRECHRNRGRTKDVMMTPHVFEKKNGLFVAFNKTRRFLLN